MYCVENSLTFDFVFCYVYSKIPFKFIIIFLTVEEGGTTSGHSYKGEFSRFLGIPNAGNRLSSSMLFLLL